jgi:hypothetical protein
MLEESEQLLNHLVNKGLYTEKAHYYLAAIFANKIVLSSLAEFEQLEKLFYEHFHKAIMSNNPVLRTLANYDDYMTLYQKISDYQNSITRGPKLTGESKVLSYNI